MWRLPILLAAAIAPALAADIHAGPVHLRSGAEREWNEFPAGPAPASLSRTFTATANTTEHTLSIRQRDVKNATWTVRVNNQVLGVLAADERDMRTYLAVAPGVLREGDNTLEIAVRSAPAERTAGEGSTSTKRQPRPQHHRHGPPTPNNGTVCETG